MRPALAVVLLVACARPPAPAPDAAPPPVPDAAAPADAGPPERAGCDGARRLVAPADPAATGPWPVGVRTLDLAGLRVEVWYPARPGSQAGAAPVAYNLADELPPAEAVKLRGRLPAVPCACFRDLPIDDAHGPYPLVLYAHGLTLVRWASVTLAAHWASRGFVVVAADFPGARLADVLTRRPGTNLGRSVDDAGRLLDAFLAAPPVPAVDGRRLALTGHSYGAEVVARVAATRGELVITMAERGVPPAARTFFTLVVGGTEDRVEKWAKQQKGFASSPDPKRLVPIEGGGHMDFTDVCSVAIERGGLYAVAHAAGVRMDGFLGYLADRGCAQTKLAPEKAWPLIKAATTAALEEQLTCPDAR